jgi:hypothetical protein
MFLEPTGREPCATLVVAKPLQEFGGPKSGKLLTGGYGGFRQPSIASGSGPHIVDDHFYPSHA